MRKTIRVALCALFVSISSFAFSQDQVNPASVDSSHAATIIFMRNTGYNGSAVAFTTFIDDTLVCRLNNKRFSTHVIEPGEHTFSVQFAGRDSKEKAERVTIKTEGGKTYYVQLVFQPGLLINNLYCQEVTESSAKTILPKLKQDAQCL